MNNTMHEIKWTNQKIARLWNYYSKNLDQKSYFSFHSGKYILDYIKSQIRLKEMKSILDFGCGPGYLLNNLIKFSRKKVYGLDFSKESIEQVDTKFKANKNFGGAVNVERLPSSFGDSSMDLVISVEVIEHLADTELFATLKEIYRVLKPKGYIVITTPNSENIQKDKTICPDCGCIFNRWQHIRSWDKFTLKEMAEKFGFSTMHVSETVFGSLPKRLYYFYNKLLKKDFTYPHLVYIGRK